VVAGVQVLAGTACWGPRNNFGRNSDTETRLRSEFPGSFYDNVQTWR